jgi:hypothetical protein
MRSVARCLTIGIAVLLPVLAGTVPAQAKLPPFSIEWSPESPSAGAVVRFTVRFWDDLEHTEPARWVDMRSFDDLLWVFPASKVPSEAVQVDLALVRPGVYRGGTTLPSAGRWTVCTWESSCPAGDGNPGYPSRLSLNVVAAPTAVSVAGDPEVAAAQGDDAEPVTAGPMWLVLIVALGCGASAVGARRVHRRRLAREPRPVGVPVSR